MIGAAVLAALGIHVASDTAQQDKVEH